MDEESDKGYVSQILMNLPAAAILEQVMTYGLSYLDQKFPKPLEQSHRGKKISQTTRQKIREVFERIPRQKLSQVTSAGMSSYICYYFLMERV
jgi:hypothetical protein